MQTHILELIKIKGLSVPEVAERMETSPTQLYRLLRSRKQKDDQNARRMTVDWLRKIAAALELPTADLLPETDNPYRLEEDDRATLAALKRLDPALRGRVPSILDAIGGGTQLTPVERQALAILRSRDEAGQTKLMSILSAAA